MRLKFLLYLFWGTTGIVTCLSFTQARADICPGVSENQRNSLAQKIEKIRTQEAQRHLTFFVGLYSKMDDSDRKDISEAFNLSDKDKMLTEIEEVQERLALRLKQDKRLLKDWLIANGLDKDVEVLKFPENNFFILFKASSDKIMKILCAAETNDLPALFSDPGY